MIRRAVTGLALLCALSAGPGARAQEGVDASTMASANNPLADMNALNFQNYHTPSLYALDGAHANTMNLRGVMVAGRQLIRATLPIATVPTGPASSVSGLGDVNIFDAFVLTGEDARTTVGVGPLLVLPTATDGALGNDAWQAGAAAVAVYPISGGSLIGGLVTWQTDFAGSDDRRDANLLTAQYFLTATLSDGWYVRSSPLMVMDFENENYLVPLGLGVGKVFQFGSAVANAFFEPQVTIYHDGDGLPVYQVFAGFNLQFPKGG